jgi:PhzF family phenazine biosynthesis protein
MHTQPTLRSSAFKQVDVFTAKPMFGNALAVVFDCEALSTPDMQRIAAWTNLSETTFVLPPTQAGADYRLRIFTPRSELPFAGHPSVGTAHAMLESERIEAKTNLVQECAAGLLPLQVVGSGADQRIFVRAPRARAGETIDATALTKSLGADAKSPPRLIHDVGPDWVICDLGSEEIVRGLKPNMDALAALGPTISATAGFCVFGRARGADYAIAVRAFVPSDGIPEDPVTGSANAAVAAYLRATEGLASIGSTYRVSQGREVGRDGYVDVIVDAASGDIDIGGQTVTCVDGMLALPHA